MSTPVMTTAHLRKMAALSDDEFRAELAADPGHYRSLLEEHLRMRDQQSIINELALARSLLWDATIAADPRQDILDSPAQGHRKAVAAAIKTFLDDHQKVTVATQIGIRTDRAGQDRRVRVLFHDGTCHRMAIDLPRSMFEGESNVDHWVHPLGMTQAPLDPIGNIRNGGRRR